MKRRMPPLNAAHNHGSFMIEALVAMVIFTLAFLGMLAMQANALRFSADATYRAEATLLANQFIGLLNVEDPANLASFQHNPAGPSCAPVAADSSATLTTGWLSDVSEKLPGATAARQKIKIDSTTGVVEIALCWVPPAGGLHSHLVTTQLNP
jgi:type IV pilus assembly protein PilV